ncbi:NTP transferase domain-containing protein [Gilvimarinus sp. DA14]|uniref:nucleotidyltransferase family protein n=1 Tax=Gilvimarinus sp. DA14 TaxID=2956798 RepID=UPI0020B6C4F5|nr:nucleotidyltransferase family protein [Gilvimarinus sp. DA14]UTF60625.1 nucleotidyltransferase family protein [Gilvimarinus sp. DA14]
MTSKPSSKSPGQHSNIVALILAAGYSRRFGSQDKRAETFDGKTLLCHTITLLQRHFAEVQVVIRAEDYTERLGVPPDTQVIRAQKAHLGQAQSMAEGFCALVDRCPPEVTSAAVFLGDMPFIGLQTLNMVCAAAEENRIVRPIYKATPGHPVVFGRHFWEDLSALSGERAGLGFVQQNRQSLVNIPVDDPGSCRDINCPQDFPSR